MRRYERPGMIDAGPGCYGHSLHNPPDDVDIPPEGRGCPPWGYPAEAQQAALVLMPAMIALAWCEVWMTWMGGRR